MRDCTRHIIVCRRFDGEGRDSCHSAPVTYQVFLCLTWCVSCAARPDFLSKCNPANLPTLGNTQLVINQSGSQVGRKHRQAALHSRAANSLNRPMRNNLLDSARRVPLGLSHVVVDTMLPCLRRPCEMGGRALFLLAMLLLCCPLASPLSSGHNSAAPSCAPCRLPDADASVCSIPCGVSLFPPRELGISAGARYLRKAA